MPKKPVKLVKTSTITQSISKKLPKQKDYEMKSSSERILSRRTFKEGEEPAFVRYGSGCTVNLGNFESGRVDVFVTLPCLPSEVDIALKTCKKLVDDQVQKEYDTLKGKSVDNYI